MQTTIQGVKISGICSTVPSHVSYFEEELKQFPFPESQSRRLGRVMGFKEHRIADAKTTLTDLAGYTLDYLFKKKYLEKENLPAIIFSAQQADHPVPGNSKVVHGNLGLSKDTHCVDLYENCTGFLAALYQACCMVNSGLDKVVVMVGDGGACYANIKDRNTYPLIGDAASCVVVSKSENKEDKISFVFHHDGSRRQALIVEAGGMRMPQSEATAQMHKDEMGNYRSLNNLYMDGTAVFHFVMEEIPPLVDEACSYAGVEKSDIDYFLMHQPNRFMLEKLAELMKVSSDILFNNIVEKFGNSSCCTIPVNIAYNLGNRLLTEDMRVCMAAFGAGLSLSSAVCKLGKLDFCEMIEHPGNGICHYQE